ncbi:MAG: methyltransferase [Planctomycetota bacterium]
MRLTIGFYTEGLPFDGDTVYRKALGGSESALVSMAAELARLGHRVKVFCRCQRPGDYAGVQYFDLRSLPELLHLFDFDVWIVSRFASALNLPVRAGLRVLWNHDVLTRETRAAVLGSLVFADMAFFLSDFHERQWRALLPEIAPIAVRTANGVDLDYLDAAVRKTAREGNVFLYSSRPERGLEVLLTAIWPRVLERLPDAELRVAGYDLAGIDTPPQVRAAEERLARLAASTPNVKALGPLRKKELYRHMARARLLLYPTAFPEVSCITAIEAQACGTPILTTADFALPETVAHPSSLIPGDVRAKECQDAFLARLFELLESPALYDEVAAAGRARVEGNHRWSDLARSWERLFLDTMRRRSERRPAAVVKELIRLGDLCAARDAAETWNLGSLREEVETRLAAAESPATEDPLFHPNPDWAASDPRCALACDILREALHDRPASTDPPRLLDVGSNNGALAVHLSNTFDDLHVLGIDYNPQALAFAEKHKSLCAGRPDRVSFRTAVLDDLVAEGECFDFLLAGEVMEHVVDAADFLAAVRAVVRPGGLVILTFPYGAEQTLWDGDRDEKDPRARRPRHPAHVHHFDFGDVMDIFGGQRDFRIARPIAERSPDGAFRGNTVVSFRVSSVPFGKPDSARKPIITRPYETLSVCMITRDSEDDLSRSLKSVAPVADEIRVHDSLSADSTVEIARRFADAVTSAPFTDFSSARNASVSGARGDWILWIDADEVLLSGANLRRYLSSCLMNGFAVRQNHLMIDARPTFDQPVRVFRAGVGYRFTGLVHEHCEDVNKGPFDHPIAPALLLPDVDIAHTGYLCEVVRRAKCLRNFPLIVDDLRRHPDRELAWILLARDFINFTNWEVEKLRALTPRAVSWLREVVRIHNERFHDPSHQYHSVSLAAYQRALEYLARAGVSASDRSTAPPVEVELGLAGAVGGLSPGGVRGERRWFADSDELCAFLADKSLNLVERLSP